jgi:hypothetical protein
MYEIEHCGSSDTWRKCGELWNLQAAIAAAWAIRQDGSAVRILWGVGIATSTSQPEHVAGRLESNCRPSLFQLRHREELLRRREQDRHLREL